MNLDNIKSLNLLNLKKVKDEDFEVPKFIFFTKKNFFLDPNSVISKINSNFNNSIIIRSSTYDEDGTRVNAGKYLSLIIKNITNENLMIGIKKVISHFKKDKDIFIIQKLITNVQQSGVIFSKELKLNREYYVINYDKSHHTDLVTSGKYNPTVKALYVARNSSKIPREFNKIIKVTKNLETKFKCKHLDIEYCIKKNKLYLLQIRRLPKMKKEVGYPKKSTIVNIQKKIKAILNSNYSNIGKKTFLSNMADWNPVEILGERPSKLAITMYKELITNEIWAKQRKNYGYKDVRPNSLLFDVYGIPYIDIRTDLNSFLPKKLNSKISQKLINYNLDKLYKNPDKHDKIEFDLLPSFIADYDGDLKKILTKKEFLQYKINTNSIFENLILKEICNLEINKIKILIKKIDYVKNSNYKPITKIFYLNYYIKQFGTLPFAGLARCAFVAKYVCDLLVDKNIISQKSIKSFYSSFKNITTNIHNDYVYYKLGKITKEKFIAEYGHLRPSTYDISFLSYEEGFKNYFKSNKISLIKKKKYKFTNLQIKKINKFFKNYDLKIKSEDFINFCIKSTEMREKAKFEFTKGINLIFIELKKLFKEMKMNKKDIQHIDYNTVLLAYSSLETTRLRETFKNEINKHISENTEAKKIILPDFIKNEKEINFFYRSSRDGEFFGNRNIIGTLMLYDSSKKQNFTNKIILIENADPGYDFIFTSNILGLVTKNGGPNSHMAIRCSELNITSIIGIGEEAFNNIAGQNKLMINPNDNLYRFL